MTQHKQINMPSMGLRGIVNQIQVINPDGTVDQDIDAFTNLILDQGLNEVANRPFVTLFENCAVGTGNSTPAVTQVELDNEKSRTSNYLDGVPNTFTFYTEQGVTPAVQSNRRTFDFPQGSLDSATDGDYTELGWSWSSSAGMNLYSRTLIKDSNGDPIAVTVNSDQILRVTYTQEIEFSPAEGGSTPTGIASSFDITNIGTINGVHQIENLGWANEAADDYATVTKDGYRVADFSGSISARRSNAILSYLSDNNGSSITSNNTTTHPLEPSATSGYATVNGGSGVIKPVFSESDTGGVGSNIQKQFSSASYVADSFEIEKTFTLSASDAIAEVRSIFLPAHRDYGDDCPLYRFLVDSADAFAVSDTHSLTITFKQSWGRV